MHVKLPADSPGRSSNVQLDDKYTLKHGRAYMSGTQALVRLPMLQRERDRRAGWNTAGFVSGYRGSPLGGLDQALWKARAHLEAHQIRFQPGINEDLAATAVWGTQQVGLEPGATVDGVFSMWYAKGPGVDRSGDALKHANAAGTSRRGGVLALAGDDHAAKSSSLPHQSDHILKACGIPVVYPASVQEILDLGLHGWALSRYAGLWVGLKCVTDVVESSASVQLDPDRPEICLPDDFELPPDGLNIRWPDTPLAQEARLLDYKLYAALAYIRKNRLNRNTIATSHDRFGIIASGKAYLDTRQALQDLGLTAEDCQRVGVRLHKVSVLWPLDASITREFAAGLQEILVVEEKRQVIEYQLKEELYNWRDDVRPRVIGKFDEKDGGEYAVPQGNWLLPAHHELSPALIAKAIAARLSKFELPPDVRERIAGRLAMIESRERALSAYKPDEERLPYYCSGCPHSTSTKVPDGSRALAGIGCHYMALWMPERQTRTFTHMGAEGVTWIGQAPYTKEPHVFANLGDGTYFHSGLLAIRAAVASGVRITYKILYNDAVAMTGGQPVDGTLTVPMIARQVQAEGVTRVVVVSDDTGKYRGPLSLPAEVDVLGRERMDEVQRMLRETDGVTVLIYDQGCAAEKRRKRKRKVDGRPVYPDPPKRLFINEAVCEGCGDCSVQSSCLSVEAVETEWGRKRAINQSTCNKDYSCLKGCCPSFVTVYGGELRKPEAPGGTGDPAEASLPEPELPAPEAGYGVLITGIGGTGVVTIGQLLGMAAHLERLGVSVLDMAGLAQKGGAVTSHVKFSQHPNDTFATRIAMGSADLVIGCDLIVTASGEVLSKAIPGKTRAVVNTTETATARFLHDVDWQFPQGSCQAAIAASVGHSASNKAVDFVDAGALAQALVGDSIAANPFMLGYVWQKGLLPVRRESLLRAIELNGVSVAMNRRAFAWGRLCAHDPEKVQEGATPPGQLITLKPRKRRLEDLIAARTEFLAAYQGQAWAARFSATVRRVRQAEEPLDGRLRLTRAVAENLSRLMTYKDEYEVARLYAEPAFMHKLKAQIAGDFRLEFNLAPPTFARRDARGHLLKFRFGGWMLAVLRVLAHMKFLRGSIFDLFGYTRERREERRLIAEYESLVDTLLAGLTKDRLDQALELAQLPASVRGFSHVKQRELFAMRKRWDELLAIWRAMDGAGTDDGAGTSPDIRPSNREQTAYERPKSKAEFS